MVLDARMAHHSGIGRYVRALVRELVRRGDGLQVALLASSAADPRSWLAGGTFETLALDAEIYTVREQLVGSWVSRRARGPRTVLHFPHYNVPWWAPAGGVVTIHDVTHFEFGGHLPGLTIRLARAAFRRAVRRAGRVIAVSAATRAALERVVPGAGAGAIVIHHGIDPVFEPLSAESLLEFRSSRAPRPYLLYVGNAKPHKNLPCLVSAFHTLQEARPGLELVLVGDRQLRRFEDPRGIRVRCEVADEELVAWYSAAEALVLPSFNEGFGLPAVEAMACGLPVVASRIETLTEVLGTCGVFFDPANPGSLVDALQSLLRQPGLREEKRRDGLRRAREFRWSATAERTVELYRELAGRR